MQFFSFEKKNIFFIVIKLSLSWSLRTGQFHAVHSELFHWLCGKHVVPTVPTKLPFLQYMGKYGHESHDETI